MAARTRNRAWIALLPLLVTSTRLPAAEPPEGLPKAELRRIEVVIDHERELALVPEGTVIPGGLEILRPGKEQDAHRRAFVFAYASEERFANLRARDAVLTDQRMSEIASSRRPAAIATSDESGVCPVWISVEFGPNLVHDLTCYRYPEDPHPNDPYSSWGWLIDSYVYQPPSFSSYQLYSVVYGNGTSETFYPWGCPPGPETCFWDTHANNGLLEGTMEAISRRVPSRPCPQGSSDCSPYRSIMRLVF